MSISEFRYNKKRKAKRIKKQKKSATIPPFPAVNHRLMLFKQTSVIFAMAKYEFFKKLQFC